MLKKNHQSIKLDESIGLTYFDHEKTMHFEESFPDTLLLTGSQSQRYPQESPKDNISELTMAGRSEFSTPTERCSLLLTAEIHRYESMVNTKVTGVCH